MNKSPIRNSFSTALLASLLLSGACDAPPNGSPVSGPVEAASGTLTIKTNEPERLQATFQRGNDVVDVTALQHDGLYDVSAKVNGMLLSALISGREQVADLDAFTQGTAAPTQIRAEDRALLLATDKAIQKESSLSALPLAKMMEHGISIWSEMSDTLVPVQAIYGDSNKGWTSLCGYCNQWVGATHDCSYGQEWEPQQTSWALVGDRTPGTAYWVDGVWTHEVPSHGSYGNQTTSFYEYGDCYGNCGESCPDLWTQQLTQDCHNHDQCVRNGHVIYDAFCDDEFSLAIDDELWSESCTAPAEYYYAYVTCTTTLCSNKLGCIGKCAACPAGYSLIGQSNGHGTCQKIVNNYACK